MKGRVSGRKQIQMETRVRTGTVLEKKRLEATGVIILLLFILLVAIKGQLLAPEGYEGMTFRNYQLSPLLLYLILGGIICLLFLRSEKISNQAVSQIVAIVTFVLMPAVNFFIFETVAGNFSTIIQNQRGIIIVNLCMWYLLYVLVFAVSNQIRFTIILLNTVMYIFAVANAFVVQFRGQPIMVMDIKSFWTAVSVAGKFHYELTVDMVLMGLLVIGCNLWIRKMDFGFSSWKKRVFYGFLAIGYAAYLLYGLLAGDFFEKAGSPWMDFFRFNDTYQKEGYLLCTMKSIRFLRVEQPEGYEVNILKDIAADVQEEKKTEKELPENIIVIMNESFADLSVLGDYKTNEAVLPYLKELSENTAQGKVLTSVYGGGTASTEFEFLTGNSMAYLPAGTVAYQMYVEEGDSSIVSVLKAYGYRTVAYHPYRKDNYNRPKVYSIYGFDEYYGKGDMKIKKIRKYASDDSDYQNLIQIYENKEPNQRLFLFNVTMQNHGGYDDETYDSAISLSDFPGEFPQTEQYLGLMHESDQAFYKLVNYFSKVEEKTVILLFGDHQPKLEDGFYQSVMQTETEEDAFINYQKMYLTPYVLWSNYDLEIETKEYISPNYLGSYLLDTIGIELPAYYRYLLELQKKIPAINVNGFLDENYGMHGIKEEGEYQELLKPYHMFVYNNMFDNKNRMAEFYN